MMYPETLKYQNLLSLNNFLYPRIILLRQYSLLITTQQYSKKGGKIVQKMLSLQMMYLETLKYQNLLSLDISLYPTL